MENRFDIIIYGATGCSGKYCVKNLIKINETENSNYSFAIAGRNKEKLKKVLDDIGKELNKDVSNIKLIEADSNNKESIINMTKQAKVLISTVGPYLFYGRVVVEACLETNTHYVDITIEAQFCEKIQNDFYDEAKLKGLYIISSCGFGSIPADLGSVYLKDQAKDLDIKYVKGYFKTKIPNGFTINTATFFSVLELFGNFKDLKSIRNEMFNKFYKDKPEMVKPSFKFLPFTIPYSNGLFVQMPPANSNACDRTQLFIHNENKEYKPTSFTEYINIPSFTYALKGMIAAPNCLIFGLFSFTRENLLKKYPRFFTLGLFGENGPTREQIEKSSFEYYVECKGKKKDSSEVISKTLYIQGAEAFYEVTSLFLLVSALVILEELDGKNKSNAGVVTPGYAFRETSYIERIRKLGIKWEIIDKN